MGIRYSALPGHTTELAEALNQELSGKWSKLRGIEIVSLGVSGVFGVLNVIIIMFADIMDQA